MAINFKKSISDPIAGDIGNKTIQGRTVSKTLQFGLFTTNENAVWAAKNQLLKESYPFAIISVPVNRDQFRLQVGDVFKLNYVKYGISNMICRVLLVEEAALNSEDIILHVMEDIFSIATAITEYTAPVDSAGTPPDYTPVAFTLYAVYEAPYVMTESIEVIPLAGRASAVDLGLYTYISIDTGSSYTKIGQSANIQPYGTLTIEYGLTYSIDNETGIYVDFATTDISVIDTITWAAALSGENNMGIMGDEIITFQTITPISGTIYKLENIIRARYGTEQNTHAIDSSFWIVNKHIGMIKHTEITAGISRKFKLTPFNRKYSGSIVDAAVIDLSITGKAKTPYIPINFNANGVSFASRYTGDIILTWTPRKRGEGAGVGVPGVVLSETDREGYFDIEVWVSSVLVRTTTDIDAITWTYSSGMNISDNGSLATEVEFRIVNHRTAEGMKYISNEKIVITKLIT